MSAKKKRSTNDPALEVEPVSRSAFALAPPRGMRDLLPEEYSSRAELRRRVRASFRAYGYEVVMTPAFELAEIIERGLVGSDRRDFLRFVEPESGEIALLRPDITPQIARIAATSMRERPGPYRLAYEGSVFRRRRGRARTQQQIEQAGVELLGEPGPGADAEILALAAKTLHAVGVDEFTLELAHVGLGIAALEPVPLAARDAVISAIAQKDASALESALASIKLKAADRRALEALVSLSGPPAETLKRARKLLKTEAMSRALDEIDAVLAALGDRFPATLSLDLGDLRGQAYYTGVSFTLWAAGPGEPIGSGGRYDGLLSRFGREMPATGFALSLENLEWALRARGIVLHEDRPPRVVVIGDGGELAIELRSRGYEVLTLRAQKRSAALEYARAWGYDLLVQSGQKLRITLIQSERELSIPHAELEQLDNLLIDERAAAARPR